VVFAFCCPHNPAFLDFQGFGHNFYTGNRAISIEQVDGLLSQPDIIAISPDNSGPEYYLLNISPYYKGVSSFYF